ncbi:MAG: OmpA family protein [Alphaproteobacteria bacterium]|nr:OmpA family protein [Alphaproteobacteria bacterium]
MKKIFILFAIFSLQIAPTFADENASNSATGTITVSGTIMIPTIDGQGTEPATGAHIFANENDQKYYAIADANGKFEIKNVPSNYTIVVSFMGMEEQTYNATKVPTAITLKENTEVLEEVVAIGCSPTNLNNLNASRAEFYKKANKCIPIECKQGYSLVTPDNKEYNIPDNCYENKDLNIQRDECTINTEIKCLMLANCSTDKNATTSAYEKQTDGTYICLVSACKNDMAPSEEKTQCTKCPCGKTANTDGTSCVDWDTKTCTNKPAHTKTVHRACTNDTEICFVDACDKGYQPNEPENATSCIQELKKCNDDDAKKHPNAKKTGIKEGTANTCIATECKCGFNLTDGKCIQWTDKDESGNPISKCDAMPDNAKNAHLICVDGKAVCKITECVSTDFDLDDQKNKCINKNKKPCTSDDKNATDAEYRTINGKMICFITDCKNTHTPSKDGTKCNPVPRLSEEDSQKKIDELKDNAQKMRDKERSTENKLLGAAGIGATGIGAMQMLSASAEQSADQDAEAAMRAYLATFHCNYGMGKNIAGGEKQVELPGGNELIGLYAEYVNLANDLKIRKNALGMRAGIESEPILDSATSGLYDDIAIGKTSGAYTSLARAIMDPTGADAIAWAAQKSDSADKLKSGAITAGIGALGSLAGNLAINSGDAKKNKVNDIIAEFDKKKKIFQDLESDIKKIPPQVEKCPTGTTGTTPNCDCTGNNVYDSNRNICNPCNAPKIIENINGDKVCKCPETHIESGDTCTPKPTGCELKGLVNFDICECIDNAATDNDNICKCINGFEENPTGTCTAKKAPEEKKEEKKEEAKTISIDMPADSLFLIGKAELSTDAKNALANFRKNMEDAKLTNCKITVTGHTDRTGKTALNQTLSEKRAQAVWDELKDSTAFNKTTSVVEGKGLAECTCGTGLIPPGKENDNDYKACKAKDATYTVANMRYAPCRRVTIKLDSNSCQSTTGGDLGNIIQTVASNITQ